MNTKKVITKCLYYGFYFNGDAAHCRDGYEDADGVLAHLKNVDALLKEAVEIAAITALEIHAPEAQLAKLREPLSWLSPKYCVLETGFRR